MDQHQEEEEEEKPNEDGLGPDHSVYGTTVYSFSDIKHM